MNPKGREGWLRPSDWRPPWPVITTVDAHAAGEPLRVVTGGLAPIPGDTMLARRRFAREHLDGLRRVLMWEPRGHADMYGAFLTPPITPGADLGVLFLHNEGFSTMCGHGVIALVTILLETACSTAMASRPSSRSTRRRGSCAPGPAGQEDAS